MAAVAFQHIPQRDRSLLFDDGGKTRLGKFKSHVKVFVKHSRDFFLLLFFFKEMSTGGKLLLRGATLEWSVILYSVKEGHTATINNFPLLAFAISDWGAVGHHHIRVLRRSESLSKCSRVARDWDESLNAGSLVNPASTHHVLKSQKKGYILPPKSMHTNIRERTTDG